MIINISHISHVGVIPERHFQSLITLMIILGSKVRQPQLVKNLRVIFQVCECMLEIENRLLILALVRKAPRPILPKLDIVGLFVDRVPKEGQRVLVISRVVVALAKTVQTNTLDVGVCLQCLFQVACSFLYLLQFEL